MTNQNKTFSFQPEDLELSVRLDKVLAARFEEFSRTQIQQLIKDEDVLVNDKPSKPSYKLEPGDTVWIKLPLPDEEYEIIPEDIPLDVLFEDEHIAVINKPAGMVVHPGHGNTEGTLVHALMARYDSLPFLEDDPARAGIVHRLDKDTSGVLVVALNDASRDDLLAQFKDRTIEKHYLALTDGHPPNDRGIIDAPIGRDPKQRKRMAVLREGRDAVTEFSVRTLYKDHALLDVHPVTGRTHQIRVHLAFINCPVVGDTVYGYRKQRINMKRLFLHAYRITLDHPATGERLTVEAPLPVGLQDILYKLPT